MTLIHDLFIPGCKLEPNKLHMCLFFPRKIHCLILPPRFQKVSPDLVFLGTVDLSTKRRGSLVPMVYTKVHNSQVITSISRSLILLVSCPREIINQFAEDNLVRRPVWDHRAVDVNTDVVVRTSQLFIKIIKNSFKLLSSNSRYSIFRWCWLIAAQAFILAVSSALKLSVRKLSFNLRRLSCISLTRC